MHFEGDQKQPLGNFDILIATQAVLRFKWSLNVQTMIIVDMDAELNRADMRSSFKGWALANQARLLGKAFLVQTRNLEHHVVKALAKDDTLLFYKEEMRLRKELEFPPFCHWVAITVRTKVETSAHNFALDLYKALSKDKPSYVRVAMPQADVPAKLRDQYRFKMIVQSVDVPVTIHFIKKTLAQLKLPSRLIVTLNVNP